MLVITIIVMLILAGAIMLSLNNSNVIGKAEEAKRLSDDANKRQVANVVLGEYMLKQQINPNTTETAEEYIEQKLQAQGINTDNVAVVNNKVIVGSGASFIKQERDTENPLKIGDYVEYTPDVKTSTKYKMVEEYTWNELGSFATESGMKWKYIGIDEDGSALLLANKPTTGKLYLEGADAYLQGPTKLNDLCKELYSGSKGEARSINAEDVNKVLGATPKPFFYDYYSYEPFELPYPKTIREIITKYNQPALTLTTTPDGRDIHDYKVSYYYYHGTQYKKADTLEYKMIFKEEIGTNNLRYWLASSCVYMSVDWITFDVRWISGEALASPTMFDVIGDSYENSLSVRPVISLKSNVQIGEKAGDMWKLN
ncbi:MAG: hypothetical protein PHR25_03470 [Clostridia bacterium]|nr:hypothetical protein [Clostridia bacterium]MDD4375821.1 hypothetical protein [Clostridia bacterium]